MKLRHIYLWLFKGWVRMTELDKLMVEFAMWGSERTPQMINLGNGWWLVSPPPKKESVCACSSHAKTADKSQP